MAALTFFGYFFLGLGPGIVFYLFFLAPKSFLVLLSLLSGFLWLVVLLAISAIFRGFYPLPDSQGAYAGAVIASVFIQEVVRHGVWRVHKKSMEMLEGVAQEAGHPLTLLDKLYVALGWGYGHGACHSVFFFLSLLPLTVGNGTYYSAVCPRMSLFLMGALYSLAFGMILASIMVISFEGYHNKSTFHVAYAPIMHMAAALLTLANFNQGGCMYVMPLLLVLGAGNLAYALQLAWRKGVPATPNRASSRHME